MKKFTIVLILLTPILAMAGITTGPGSGVGGTTTTNLTGGTGIIISAAGVTNIVAVDTNTIAQKTDLLPVSAIVQTGQVSAVSFVLSPAAPTDGNSNWFGPWTPGTKTAGIQEILNSKLKYGTFSTPGGGKIYIKPGLYQIGAPITNIVSTGTYDISIEGANRLSTILLQTNSIPMPVFRFTGIGGTNYQDVHIENLGICSVTNACTNLVEIVNPVPGTFSGAIGGGSIIGCYFDCWLFATNNGTTGLATGVSAQGGKKNLTSIYFNGNYGSQWTVTRNVFYDSTLWVAADSIMVFNNQFVGCGSTTVNDWPVTDPRYRGTQVVVTDPVGGVPNNLHQWNFNYNHFVGNVSVYLINPSGATTNFSIIGNTFEGNSIRPVQLGTNNGSTVTLIDCTADLGMTTLKANYLLTSTTDYSAPTIPDTNAVPQVRIVDHASRFVDFPFNATNPANVFAGSGVFTGTFIATNMIYTNTTTLPAPQLNSSIPAFSNGVAYVVSAGAILPGTTNQFLYDNSFLNASQLTSGTVASARLGTGTANSTTYLRGDGTWNTPSGGGATTYFSQVLMTRNGDISPGNTYSAPFYFYNGFSTYDPKFNCILGSGDIVSVSVTMVGIGGTPIGTGNDLAFTLVTNGVACTSSKVTLLGSSTSANYANMTNVLLATPPHLSTNDVVQILTTSSDTNNITGSEYIGLIYSVTWKNYNQ